jgi:hypothetical protein
MMPTVCQPAAASVPALASNPAPEAGTVTAQRLLLDKIGAKAVPAPNFYRITTPDGIPLCNQHFNPINLPLTALA